MDYQRILIFMGLAVTGYLLMLAWQEDYGQQATRNTVESSTTQNVEAFPSEPAVAAAVLLLKHYLLIPLSQMLTPRQVPHRSRRSPILCTFKPMSSALTLTYWAAISFLWPYQNIPRHWLTPDQPLKLIDSGNQYVSQSGLIGPNGTDKNGARPVYEARFKTFELKAGQSELQVVLTPKNPDQNGVRIDKIFTFKPQDYLIDVRYEIANGSNNPVNMAFFGQIKRDGRPPLFQVDNAMGLKPYLGIATRTQEDLYDKIDLSDLEDGAYQQDFTGGYIAFLQHYFLSAWCRRAIRLGPILRVVL